VALEQIVIAVDGLDAAAVPVVVVHSPHAD